jgi:hypothetical protein
LPPERIANVQPLSHILGAVDHQVLFYTVLALIPNLFLILWAMARLSRDVRLIKMKINMVEEEIKVLDQLDRSISTLTADFQASRKGENEMQATSPRAANGKTA